MSKCMNVLLKEAGKINPTSVEEYVAHGGYEALKNTVNRDSQDVIDELTHAELLGRGGAAYPAGRKWHLMNQIPENPKYIVCNADEGEPGTFKDRDLLQYTPFKVIEGMTIAGRVFRSPRGFIYIRGEYRNIQKIFQEAIDNATKAGYLGKNIMGIEGFDYTITIVSGGGAYVCGENSSLLNSIEGKAGRPRIKPPHLAEVGLYSLPTLVNNVESYAHLTVIFAHGAEAFREYGVENSRGTKLISISGHAKNRGVYEIGLGKLTLREIMCDPELGGGTPSGRPIKFYHLGGQSGPIGFPEQLDVPYGYQTLKENGLSVGSGAVVVLDDSVCLVDYCRKVMEFFVHESCGKCVPCRVGTTRALELLQKLCDGRGEPGDVDKLEHTVKQIAALSACGLGQSVDKAILPCLKMRREEFLAHEQGTCPCGGCKEYAKD